MRRNVLMLAAAVVVMLLLLCGAGAARVWSAQGRGLVMPGSSDVRIDREGTLGLHVTYHLPRGQTLPDLTKYLAGQGWRRIKFPNFDRTTLSFVRQGWAAQTREILVVALDDSDRRLADMRFGRCVKFGSWLRCA